MRHGSSNRRHRNRGSNGGARRSGGNQKTQVFDSNGPDVRIRGTAYQVCEKYLALAKDSQAAGDVILWQSYLQHAEHYQRMINSWAEEDGYDDEGDEVDEAAVNAEQRHSQNRRPHIDQAQQGQSHQGQQPRRDQQQQGQGQRKASQDDLSLPSSILGGFSKSDPQKQAEMESS